MYRYQELKKEMFTERGFEKYQQVKEKAESLFNTRDIVTMRELISGDVWLSMACVDRLVEEGLLTEVSQNGDVIGQNRLFFKG